MEPIVSPWFIYLIGVASQVQGLAIGFLVVSIGLLIGWFIHRQQVWINTTSTGGADDKAMAKCDASWGRTRYLIIAMFLVCTVIIAFTPNRKILIGMCVANAVTYDSVGKTAQGAKAIKDELKQDILDLIESFDGKRKPKSKGGD